MATQQFSTRAAAQPLGDITNRQTVETPKTTARATAPLSSARRTQPKLSASAPAVDAGASAFAAGCVSVRKEPKQAALRDDVATPQRSLFQAPASRYLLRSLEPTEQRPTLTIVLDLDETLVSNRRMDLPDAILRPFVLEALQALRALPNVEIVMWTASTEDTAAPVVRQLGRTGFVFDDVICRNDVWFTEPVHSKDLRLLGRDMSRVVVFDNAANCVKLNKGNGLLVDDFMGQHDPTDNTLVNVFRACQRMVAEIEAGGTVPSAIAQMQCEEQLCKTVTHQMPEAWRQVSLHGIPSLMIPPHGDFVKIVKTNF